jgi:hypothetical protein
MVSAIEWAWQSIVSLCLCVLRESPIGPVWEDWFNATLGLSSAASISSRSWLILKPGTVQVQAKRAVDWIWNRVLYTFINKRTQKKILYKWSLSSGFRPACRTWYRWTRHTTAGSLQATFVVALSNCFWRRFLTESRSRQGWQTN